MHASCCRISRNLLIIALIFGQISTPTARLKSCNSGVNSYRLCCVKRIRFCDFSTDCVKALDSGENLILPPWNQANFSNGVHICDSDSRICQNSKLFKSLKAQNKVNKRNKKIRPKPKSSTTRKSTSSSLAESQGGEPSIPGAVCSVKFGRLFEIYVRIRYQ